MSDERKQAAATEIAYCPHLQIYHYLRVDGVDQIFDSSQLERAIETFQKQGDERQAEFMALLTGFARQFPHQVVSFDDQGKLNLRELLAAMVHSDLVEGRAEGHVEDTSDRLQLVGSEAEKDDGGQAGGRGPEGK